MITLHEFPPTRSQRVKWALEELGVAYAGKRVDMMAGAQNTEAYRAIHPLGVVPALETDEYAMFESVAIVLQMIDENPHAGLAPDAGTPARALYYQWSVFAAAEMDPAIMTVFDNTLRPLAAMRPEGRQHSAEAAELGRYEFALRAAVLSDALQDRDYLLGPDFSGADVVIGHSCFMAAHIGLMEAGVYPVLDGYFGRLQVRPAYQSTYDPKTFHRPA